MLSNSCYNQSSFIEKIEASFWTNKQRQSNSIHEITYRACFKAELPRFFIEKYSKTGDVIYDPFSGRGTTGIEACLLGRKAIFNDINPLSRVMSEPRINIINIDELEKRFDIILSNNKKMDIDIDLSMFFHENTLQEILKIRNYLKQKQELDIVDKWIKLLVLNRLTGHSSGFLSVYTLPPNQAITGERQKKINEKYNNVFTYRSVKECCLKKYKTLTKDVGLFEKENLSKVSKEAIFLNNDAQNTSEIQNESIDLIITSPPFLDVINYKQDNWMRCWFCDIDIAQINISQIKNLDDWNLKMKNVLLELKRVLKNDGYIAFEVGEVKSGKINLEDEILKILYEIGFYNIQILINKQTFSKTSNIWGVENNAKGTNSNRILLIKNE
jgi:DNA modification methylase